jgi:hypothetical protein
MPWGIGIKFWIPRANQHGIACISTQSDRDDIGKIVCIQETFGASVVQSIAGKETA